jgi:hypothetical protein
MRSISLEGLTPLRTAGPAVLKLAHAEHDPVAVLRTRYRLVWDAVNRDESLAERIGGRLFVRDSKLPALAAALGVVSAPAPAPKRRRPVPTSAIAA